jgi:hypothetical protein
MITSPLPAAFYRHSERPMTKWKRSLPVPGRYLELMWKDASQASSLGRVSHHVLLAEALTCEYGSRCAQRPSLRTTYLEPTQNLLNHESTRAPAHQPLTGEKILPVLVFNRYQQGREPSPGSKAQKAPYGKPQYPNRQSRDKTSRDYLQQDMS